MALAYLTISLDSNNNFVYTADEQGVLEDIAHNLNLWLGESNFNTTDGVDYQNLVQYGFSITPYASEIVAKWLNILTYTMNETQGLDNYSLEIGITFKATSNQQTIIISDIVGKMTARII